MTGPSRTEPLSFHDRLIAQLHTALNRSTPLSTGRRAACWLLGGLLLLGPFVSHWHKAFHPDRPHGDWFSIFAIADYSLDTGKLEANEADPIVRTQRYPPITRPLLMLFAVVPKAVSAVLSFALFAVLYVWSASQVSRIFFTPSPPSRSIGTALALALVLPYVWADLTAGNLTSVLLASVTGAYVLAGRGHPLRAGVVLSVGIMLKIIPVLCLLYFIVRRKWRVAWGVALGVVLLGILPSLALFGPQKLWDYHDYWYRTQFLGYTPMNTIDHPNECTYQNQAVVRTMVRLFTDVNAGSSSKPFKITIAPLSRTALKAAYLAIMLTTGLALLWYLWRTRSETSARTNAATYALCVGSMLWFSPWVGSYYYALAIWPAAGLLGYLLGDAHEPRVSTRTHLWHGRPAGEDTGETPVPQVHLGTLSRTRWVRGALVLWLLAMPAIGSHLLRAWGTHTWCAALMLVALAAAFAPSSVTAIRPNHQERSRPHSA